MKLHRIFFLLFVPFFLLAGDGLRGNYYNKTSSTYNAAISGMPTLTRTDATVDFPWGIGSPATGINANNFQAQWTGFIQIPTSGTWTFYTQSDDGVRLTINGQNLISNWTDHGSTENSASLTLSAGYYPIVMEFYERGGAAVAQLRWQGPSTSKAIIPQTYLFTSLNVITGDRNFAIRNPLETRNIKGNLAVIGNTILCPNGTCDYTGTLSNSELDLQFINTEGYAGTYRNSSRATLSIPDNATIKWAGLYTQGYLSNRTAEATARTQLSTEPNVFKIHKTNTSLNIFPSVANILNQTGQRWNGWNWVNLASVGYTHSTFSEITYLKDKKGSEVNGLISVANIKAVTGRTAATAPYSVDEIRDGLGNFGAWTLAIVYEDSNATLKNISIFDGYKAVSNGNNVDITFNGFLTPTKGTINSNLSVFAAEGDRNIVGDTLSLDGTDISVVANNAFNSSIMNVTRNPNITNNQGIDIHNYNVSSIIRNNQSSATLRLTSTGDMYYPSMVGFSTELYTPDVCYLEDLSFNGLPISATNLPSTGDTVDYNVTITNKSSEPAKGILIEKRFDKSNEIRYNANSLQIAPIPGTTFSSKTDATADDTAEYSNDTARFLLGSGANATNGGSIGKDEITRFKYQAIVGDQNASQNTYLVSYRNDLLGVTFTGIPIRKCSDFDNSFGIYVPVIGKFNTVRQNAVNVGAGQKDPIDPADTKNALYTQIVGRSFNVDVISFDADNETPRAPSIITDLNLSIVELSSDGECTDTNLSSIYPLNFSTTSKYRTQTVTASKASQNAAFRMKTNNVDLCSRDRFAIRPATYAVEVRNTSGILQNKTNLIGGKAYDMTFVATTENTSVPSIGYNQSFFDNSQPLKQQDHNISHNIIIPTGCTDIAVTNDDTNHSVAFNSITAKAVTSPSWAYPNIGKVKFKLQDLNWTKPSDDVSKGDCIDNSFSNTLDGNGKIGCGVYGEDNLTFKPNKFIVPTFNLSDFNNNFTYIADINSTDRNMSASILMMIRAVLDDNTTTATHYTKSCYDKNVSFELNCSNAITSTYPLVLIPEFNATKISDTNHSADFNISEGNFTNGEVTVKLNFNFDRNTSNPTIPFKIFKTDFNITTLSDDNGTLGDDFNHSVTPDNNATFYYGRVHAPDQRFSGTTGTANIYYEVYCRNCTDAFRTNMGITGNQSVDAVNWYQNNLHVNNTFGEFNSTAVTATSNGLTLGARTLLTQNLTAGSTPHVNRVNFGSSSWLRFYPEYFKVEFVRPGNWAGEGSVDRNQTAGRVGGFAHENNVTRAHRRMNW